MHARNAFANANPFILWTRLSLKTWEMLFASAQVIHHRTGRMARAGIVPDARDRREFHRMGQEKLEAVAESLQAVAFRTFTFQQQAGLALWRQCMAGMTGWATLAGSRSAVHAAQVQGEMLRRAMQQSAGSIAQAGNLAARLLHTGLLPIHSRATANARRLAKIAS